MTRAHLVRTAAPLALSLWLFSPMLAGPASASTATAPPTTGSVFGPDTDWLWPVDGSRDVLRDYRAPATRYSAGHRGIDVRGEGPVVAPADGVVHFVGFVVDRPILSITHDGGLVSSFEPVTSDLAVGNIVRRGQPVGTVAAGGGGAEPAGSEGRTVTEHCGQRCLHLGVRLHGEYLSPLALFGEIPPAVLLPPRAQSR
ncbi:MAG: peptidoglycan DD-metalloendopeptidase family protein [Glaciihabitans sp.]